MNSDDRSRELQEHTETAVLQLLLYMQRLCRPIDANKKANVSSVDVVIEANFKTGLTAVLDKFSGFLTGIAVKDAVFAKGKADIDKLPNSLRSVIEAWSEHVVWNTYKSICQHGGRYHQKARKDKENSRDVKHNWLDDNNVRHSTNYPFRSLSTFI
jgi:hypothetical protein